MASSNNRFVIRVGPCKYGGEQAFGMQNGRIQDSQITASSIYDAGLSTTQGRLNSASSWSAIQNGQPQWIQADLGREGVVTAIGTQGRRHHPEWVETYSVYYGSNGNVFEPYTIDDVVKRLELIIVVFERCKSRRKCSRVNYFIFSNFRWLKLFAAPDRISNPPPSNY